jgi:Fic family protein
LQGYRDLVHYVAPKPQDVTSMMDGLLQCSERLAESDVDPVVQAAVLGFGFVFVHPFDDGNGRLHRYLIHHVLARAGFTPEGMVLPVSATMLADPRAYDGCLERFSRPLLARLEYDLDRQGAMTVHGETADYYRYFDATAAAEYLYGVVEQTIERDLAGELDFLARFDAAWRELREIVDLPDRRLELFLRLCLGNRGKLSARKRALFAELADDEVAAMEDVVQASGVADDDRRS